MITFVTLMSTISPQLQILVSEVLEVVKMILVGIPQQNVSEEWTAIVEDHFMSSNLLIIYSNQGDIYNQIISKLPNGVSNNGIFA